MKKRLASLLLALAMCLTLLPGGLLCPQAVSAEAEDTLEGVTVEYQESTGDLVVHLAKTPTQSRRIIAAVYDDAGRMTNVAVADVAYGQWQALLRIPSAERYRLFLTDTDGAPLCPSKTVTNYGSVQVYQGNNVTVPTMDAVCANGMGLALDAFVEAALLQTKLMETLNDSEKRAEACSTEAGLAELRAQIAEAEESWYRVTSTAAVLDAAAELATEKPVAAGVRAQRVFASSGALAAVTQEQWAANFVNRFKKYSDTYNGTTPMKDFAAQLGHDARYVRAMLKKAEGILDSQAAMNEASWKDFGAKASQFIATGSKIALFIGGTVLTAGGAAAATATTAGGALSAAAAGGMTVMEAAGTVISGADCAVSIVRDGAKIFLGDDHETVVKVEDKFTGYDTAMFIYGLATFNYKEARTDELLVFANDLSNQFGSDSTYENIKLLHDTMNQYGQDAVGVSYVGIEAQNEAQLGPKALELIRNGGLSANESGIATDAAGDPVDTTLGAGKTVGEVGNTFAEQVDSGDAEIARLFTRLKDGEAVDDNATLHGLVDEFDGSVKIEDEEQQEEEPPVRPRHEVQVERGDIQDVDGVDPPPNPGTAYLPDPEGGDDPTYWVNTVEGAPGKDDEGKDIWTDTYKNCYGDEIGTMTYQIESDGSYWQKTERRLCKEGRENYNGELCYYQDWMITSYYSKYDYYGNPNEAKFEYTDYDNKTHTIALQVQGRNTKASCYVRREYYRSQYVWGGYGDSAGFDYGCYDNVSFWPNGKVGTLQRRRADNGDQGAKYEFSPDGNLYSYLGEGARGYYEYYVYEDQGIWIEGTGTDYDGRYAFDPTGHLATYYAGSTLNTKPDKTYEIAALHFDGYAHYYDEPRQPAWDNYYYGYNRSDHSTLESILLWFSVDRSYEKNNNFYEVDEKPSAPPYTQP